MLYCLCILYRSIVSSIEFSKQGNIKTNKKRNTLAKENVNLGTIDLTSSPELEISTIYISSPNDSASINNNNNNNNNGNSNKHHQSVRNKDNDHLRIQGVHGVNNSMINGITNSIPSYTGYVPVFGSALSFLSMIIYYICLIFI